MSSNWPRTSADTDVEKGEAADQGFRSDVDHEREAALRAPGPSWSDWLYSQAIRWWLGIALLIVDTWIAAGWIEIGAWIPLAVSLVAALYLEYLLFQYLWHPYDPELRGRFRRSWHTPVEVGRWAPDRERALRGDLGPDGEARGPDPKEFL